MGSPMLLVSLGWALLMVLGAMGHTMPYYWEHWGWMAGGTGVIAAVGSTGLNCAVLLVLLGALG